MSKQWKSVLKKLARKKITIRSLRLKAGSRTNRKQQTDPPARMRLRQQIKQELTKERLCGKPACKGHDSHRLECAVSDE